jgi:probable H4MPT-linked C1 transfer pathway protein
MPVTAGLDIGGAHLKVALAEDGRVIDACQIVCPLWQGLDKLEAAFAQTGPMFARAHSFGVTMTGELSDLFADRKAGVETLVAFAQRELGPGTQFWMGRRGFGDARAAVESHVDTGSTNFLASAALVAMRLPDALLVDFGSTSVDIIPVVGGKPAPRGLTDGERLTTGELVYTGLTRTAVMGVATRAPWKGEMQRLAREYLATMADVRRILGVLPDDVDEHATADGRGKSVEESLARFARMLGRDAADGSNGVWRAAAVHVRDEQLQAILEGIRDVEAAQPIAPSAPVVAAGIGAGEIFGIAGRLGRRPIAFGEIANAEENCRLWATRCAPAAAVALLQSLQNS